MTETAASSLSYADLYGHGGRLGAAARHFPQAPGPWIDLSTGISPWPYPIENSDVLLRRQEPKAAGRDGSAWAPAFAGAQPDISGACLDWTRLPEPEALARLEAAAATSFGARDPGEVVAVPGSDLAIRLLPQLMGQAHAHYVAPIYSGHRSAWPDARPVAPDKMDKADFLILANPNNPDGRAIDPETLRALPGQLIVDEAFADASPEVSLAPNRWGAIVLRSFGKFFGLAGLRLGFVLADRPLAGRLRALLGDWPVSGPAISIATAAYEDKDWQAAQRARLHDASGRLDALLRSAGLAMAGGTPLFRFARTEGAPGLFRHLGGAGILVRPFAEDSTALRFGLPGDELHWQRLEQALSAWSKQ